MKIADILGGTKKRKHRDPRKRRVKQRSLFTIHGSDLNEAKGRDINHIEDLLLFYGKEGGQRALNALRSLEHTPQDTTIKWDGSPAVIFGRNEQGEFVLTDKSGYGAKGYDGKVTSPEALEKMFMQRKMKDPSPEKQQQRKEFASRMAGMWSAFEDATPADFRGYIHGDLMYSSKPQIKDGKLVFQPNTTTYAVNPRSEIGQKIANSNVGVVVHAQIDLDGNKSRPDTTNFQAGELLILPPVSPSAAPEVQKYEKQIATVEQQLNSKASQIEALINPPADLKMSDFQNMLYTYVNNTVKTGEKPGAGFLNWVVEVAKVSEKKKERVVDWVQQNKDGFNAIWEIFNNISIIKNNMVKHLDDQPADIEAYTDGQRGGEGYVVGKDMKLVNRAGFTAANFARAR